MVSIGQLWPNSDQMWQHSDQYDNADQHLAECGRRLKHITPKFLREGILTHRRPKSAQFWPMWANSGQRLTKSRSLVIDLDQRWAISGRLWRPTCDDYSEIALAFVASISSPCAPPYPGAHQFSELYTVGLHLPLAPSGGMTSGYAPALTMEDGPLLLPTLPTTGANDSKHVQPRNGGATSQKCAAQARTRPTP